MTGELFRPIESLANERALFKKLDQRSQTARNIISQWIDAAVRDGENDEP